MVDLTVVSGGVLGRHGIDLHSADRVRFHPVQLSHPTQANHASLWTTHIEESEITYSRDDDRPFGKGAT
jgi:hypothetical protein